MNTETGLWMAGTLGLVVGSFLNVVVHRLPLMIMRPAKLRCGHKAEDLSLSWPRSHCPQCGHQLSAWELVPVMSFIVLHGRCRQCKAPISWLYPATEVFNALLWLGCIAVFGATVQGYSWAIFASVLLALARIDLQTTLLPDALTLPLLVAGLVLASLGWTQTNVQDAFWGAAVGYGLFYGLDWLYLKARGQHGMGGGDAKLLAALLAWFGWQALVPVLAISSLSALAMTSVQGFNPDSRIAFGPYLALGGLVMAANRALPLF